MSENPTSTLIYQVCIIQYIEKSHRTNVNDLINLLVKNVSRVVPFINDNPDFVFAADSSAALEERAGLFPPADDLA